MRINNKEDMDLIVNNNPNFKWDNWTVIVFTEDNGYYTKHGVFKDNEWKTQYRYNMVDYNVWEIPDRFLSHVQL